MKRCNKKGFTIVELVIVIAVIAILAAVLIPTIAGLVKKANIAVDKKAVADINTQLAMVEAEYGKPTNYGEVVEKLLANNFDIADYKPLAKDYTFYYDKELNKVLYVKDHTTVEFPEAEAKEELKIAESAATLGRWSSLSGKVKVADYTVENGTVNITSGAQLVSLMGDVASNKVNITTVNLNADVDLMGSSANFGKLENNTGAHVTFTFNGNNHVIYGLMCDDNAYEYSYNPNDELKGYGYGLFGSIRNYTTLKISNLTIKDAVINATKGDRTIGHAGILAGNVTGDGAKSGKLEASNITIDGGYVIGTKKVGALIGYIAIGAEDSVKLTDITIKNVDVIGGERSGRIFGHVNQLSSLSDDLFEDYIAAFDITATDCTTTYRADLNLENKPEGTTTKDFWYSKAAGTYSDKNLADYQ